MAVRSVVTPYIIYIMEYKCGDRDRTDVRISVRMANPKRVVAKPSISVHCQHSVFFPLFRRGIGFVKAFDWWMVLECDRKTKTNVYYTRGLYTKRLAGNSVHTFRSLNTVKRLEIDRITAVFGRFKIRSPCRNNMQNRRVNIIFHLATGEETYGTVLRSLE